MDFGRAVLATTLLALTSAGCGAASFARPARVIEPNQTVGTVGVQVPLGLIGEVRYGLSERLDGALQLGLPHGIGVDLRWAARPRLQSELTLGVQAMAYNPAPFLPSSGDVAVSVPLALAMGRPMGQNLTVALTPHYGVQSRVSALQVTLLRSAQSGAFIEAGAIIAPSHGLQTQEAWREPYCSRNDRVRCSPSFPIAYVSFGWVIPVRGRE